LDVNKTGHIFYIFSRPEFLCGCRDLSHFLMSINFLSLSQYVSMALFYFINFLPPSHKKHIYTPPPSHLPPLSPPPLPAAAAAAANASSSVCACVYVCVCVCVFELVIDWVVVVVCVCVCVCVCA